MTDERLEIYGKKTLNLLIQVLFPLHFTFLYINE